MKRKVQGYNARLDESLGERHRGPHHQSMKDRRDESKAMGKYETGHAYSGDHDMDKGARKQKREARREMKAKKKNKY